ncbi:MAG: hypothetical protein CMJ49_11460 [Planctomycetaceae bacterium]|nr:hypothetical protein [Planctomycetaceae bacterium]
MKHSSLFIAIVVCATAIICTAMISSAVKSMGRSMERAASRSAQGRALIPKAITLRTPDLSTLTFRVTNHPGGASFRLQEIQ